MKKSCSATYLLQEFQNYRKSHINVCKFIIGPVQIRSMLEISTFYLFTIQIFTHRKYIFLFLGIVFHSSKIELFECRMTSVTSVEFKWRKHFFGTMLCYMKLVYFIPCILCNTLNIAVNTFGYA